jgi:hypothetical protein
MCPALMVALLRVGALLHWRRQRPCDLAIDRPKEGGQLAGDRDDDDCRPLSLPDQRPEAPAQPCLGFPGDSARRPWRRSDPRMHVFAHAWRKPITPCGFDEEPAGAGVSGLGDAAALDALAR